ncbi:hypothetical protein C8R46DRAFT_1235465 [Mycena filopes]|nr:hypothetical protein C8R46DRAFT_1235465 [Mycena filopes]
MSVPELSVPPVLPDQETLLAFWAYIAHLTTWTRLPGRGSVGSPEVLLWNACNREACERCTSSRSSGPCVVEDDQPSCLQCRKWKTACDRKMRFLFENTREDFFPTKEQFIYVYNERDRRRCRSLKKMANKRRRSTLSFIDKDTNSRANVEALQSAQQEICNAQQEIETLRSQLRQALSIPLCS